MAAIPITYQPLGGYVTSDKDFLIKSNKPHHEGLFSEQIFGPQRSYCCVCGLYNNKNLYKGMICPKCGVICDNSDLRTTTFGRINTVFPFVNVYDKKEIINIIGNSNSCLIDSTRSDFLRSTKHFIGIHGTNGKIRIFDKLETHSDYAIIPLSITGVYSLYIILKFLDKYLEHKQINSIFTDNVFTNILLVLPPNIRPISFKQESKQLITSPINKPYSCILKLNNEYLSLREHLINDEEELLERLKHHVLIDKKYNEEIVDCTLMQYDMYAGEYQKYVNQLIDFGFDELSGKFGIFRDAMLGKNIEFSARAVICADPSLPPYKIRVSKKILKKLWAPYFIYYLSNIRNINCDDTYHNLINGDFNHLFDEFLIWFQPSKDITYPNSI